MWRSRMFWRMFGMQAVLLLLAIGLLGALVVRRVEDRYSHEIKESLRARALVVGELVRDLTADQTGRVQDQLARLREETGTRFTLLADDYQVLVDTDHEAATMETHADRPEVQRAREDGFATVARFSSTLGQPLMYGALRTGDKGQAVAYVRIAVPLDHVQAELTRLRGIVWTTAGGTAL